jgi:hypothetical protein
MNLIFASWLVARYTHRRSTLYRAILDFMYGTERAETIDKYFLKNFEDDPDYAKRWLTSTLLEFRGLAQRGFAERMDARRKFQQSAHRWNYYELIAIEHEKDRNLVEQTEQSGKREYKYKVIYRPLLEDKSSVDWESEPHRIIKDDMFRISISIKNADFLEYIVAPGEYHAPFPRLGSVLGLALEMRQTIVMDRDRDRKFRNKDHKDGVSPGEIEQPRGLDEIDYLSYVSIPVVSRKGEPTENALGVLNIDTKIFVSRDELAGQTEESGEGVFSIRQTRTQLTSMASDLYDGDVEAIKYLEDLTKIVRPILELYARCRVGA